MHIFCEIKVIGGGNCYVVKELVVVPDDFDLAQRVNRMRLFTALVLNHQDDDFFVRMAEDIEKGIDLITDVIFNVYEVKKS